MWKLLAINEHNGTSAMNSYTSDVRFEGVVPSQSFWNGYRVRYVGLVLIHTINDNAHVLGRVLFCLVTMLGILLTLISANQCIIQRTSEYSIPCCTHND